MSGQQNPTKHPHHSSISPPINHLLLAQPSGLLPSHPPRNSARFRLPCKYIVISILDCRHALVSKSRLQSQGPCPCLSHRPSNLRHPSAHPHLPTCKCEPIDCVCLFFFIRARGREIPKKKNARLLEQAYRCPLHRFPCQHLSETAPIGAITYIHVVSMHTCR